MKWGLELTVQIRPLFTLKENKHLQPIEIRHVFLTIQWNWNKGYLPNSQQMWVHLCTEFEETTSSKPLNFVKEIINTLTYQTD